VRRELPHGRTNRLPFIVTMSCRTLLAAALALAMLWGCGSGPTPLAQEPVAPAVASSVPQLALPSATHHAPEELDPSLATARAPEVFFADFTTSKGNFVVEVHRAWAPNAADRFYNLVKLGFYDDDRFFRAIPDFMAQFGIPGDPQVTTRWRHAAFADDPVVQSNLRGFVSFARTGEPNSSATQVFISFENHPGLDASGFAPFGKVARGMEVVDDLYKGYGEGAPNGAGPDQHRIETEGNAYLDREFPKLDRILYTRIVPQ
jgi:peptidyl-prolyl cis-trans isomerase A (cyclophilin A)